MRIVHSEARRRLSEQSSSTSNFDGKIVLKPKARTRVKNTTATGIAHAVVDRDLPHRSDGTSGR